MIVTQQTDYRDAALALLTSQYTPTAAPNLRALIGALTSEQQNLENTLFNVINGRVLAQATNAQLDALGALIGQPRSGQSDSDYRSTIYLRIAVNRSFGRITDWSGFAALLLRTSSGPVTFVESGNASFQLFIGGMTLNPNVVAGVLQAGVPNGVGPNDFIYSTWGDGNDFEWADVNNLATTGQGTFGDSVAGLVGGLLVSAQAM